MLPAADVERVVRSLRQIAACRSSHDLDGVDGATTTLIDVYRDGSERIFQFGSSTRLGRPMSDVLEESRAVLRSCGDRTAAGRVDNALATGDG